VTPEERIQRCYRHLQTISVTGTNGKSTTTSMLASIVQASGEPYAKMTTLGADVNGELITENRALFRYLVTVEKAVDVGVRTLTLEVTSKALSQGFAQRWASDVAVFTNLSRDHLDMHKSPEEYLAAKAQLFMHLAPGGTAILNADDPSSELLAMILPEGRRVEWFSPSGKPASLSAKKIEVSLEGTKIEFQPSRMAECLGGSLQLRVVGDVHAANAMAAALAAISAGYNVDAIQKGLAAFQTLPGRFEIVSQKPLVIVDYAHTPDGLRGTLKTARPLCGDAGQLICIFGCGGNRDSGKRQQMGQIADQYSDKVVLTSDNPRHESPDSIAQQVLQGRQGGALWMVIHDRREAIYRTLEQTRPADVVIVAGKGHEQEQIIADQHLPFCDAATVNSFFRQQKS